MWTGHRGTFHDSTLPIVVLCCAGLMLTNYYGTYVKRGGLRPGCQDGRIERKSEELTHDGLGGG